MKKIVLKKIRFQLALNKPFCPTSPPLINRSFKHRQRTKINKTMLSASPTSVFHTKFTISVLKSTWDFHPNGNWTWSVSVWVFNWVSIVYATTDSEHKFHKTGIENWLPIEFNLTLITTTLCSTTNGESLKVLYTHPLSLGITLETFQFLETVQVLSNPTPITQSSIKPQ